MSIEKKKKLNEETILNPLRTVGLVFVFSLFMAGTFGFGLDLVSNILPDIKLEFSLTSADIGWITGIGRFGFVIGAILAGFMVYFMSPTILVIVAVAGSSLTLFLLSRADSFQLTTAIIFIISTFTALSWVPMAGVFALFIHEKDRAKAFGAIIAGSGIGTSLAGYLSPFFITNYSWRTALSSASALISVILVLGLIFIIHCGILNEKIDTGRRTNSIKDKPITDFLNVNLLGILFMFFLVGYTVHPFQIFLSTYLRIELQQEPVVAGNAWLTIGLVGTWGGLLMGYLGDRFGIKQTMVLAILLLLISTIILIYLHTPAWFIVSAFIFSLSYYCMPGLLPAFLSIHYPPKIAVRFFSIGSMMLGLGTVVGNIIGGEISYYFKTLEAYYWTCIIVAFLLFICTYLFMKEKSDDPLQF